MSTTLRDRLRNLFGRTDEGARLKATVDTSKAIAMVRDGAALLDVREPHEWRAGHAPQAIHVPLGQLDKAQRRLPKDGPVLVMCASGMRSRTAAKRLRALGLEAASVSGGLTAWQQAGGAVRR